MAGKDSSITFWAQPEPFCSDEKKLKNYQKNRLIDILDPGGLHKTVEIFLNIGNHYVTSTTEVNGWRQKRGLDVKFASKLDFSDEALVAYPDLRTPK